MGPNLVWLVSLWKGEFRTQTHPRENAMGRWKAENRMMLLEVREHQRWPANHQTQGERPSMDSVPWLLEGINSDDSMVLVTADLSEWVKSLSCVGLFATQWTVACQASPSTGFSRQEYWSGLSFPSPGDLPDLQKYWITSYITENSIF